MIRTLAICAGGLALCATLAAAILVPSDASPQNQDPGRKRKVTKTDQEWQKILTRDQFLVTRRKFTEPAFTGKLTNNHLRGTYLCVCCGAELFSSRAKFDSGTGWPSFDRPVARSAVDTAPDFEDGTQRTEVMCMDCGAHLGHVFGDGPTQTGLRYCMNSAALKFVREAPATKKPASKSKGKSTPKDDSKKTEKPKATDHAE